MKENFLSECKYILNNKTVFFVLIIAPILINILLGLIFSSGQIRQVTMAVYDQDNSSLSRTIIEEFRANEIFNLKYFVNSEDELQQLFFCGDIRCAIVIPKDFLKDVKDYKNPNIMMVYDGSNMSMVSAAKARANEILLTLKAGISMKVVEAKLNLSKEEAESLVQTISFRNRFLYNPTKSFEYFLNTGLGVAIIQTCIVLAAVSAIRKEELDILRIKRLGYLSSKILFYGIIGALLFMVSILMQRFIFGVPFRSNFLTAFILSLFMAIAISAFSIMISSWFSNKSLALLINAIIFIPSAVFAGYTWPVLSMPRIYQIIAPLFPFYHFGDNIRNLYLKGIEINTILPDLQWFCILTVASIIIGFLGIMRIDISEVAAAQDDE